MNKYRVDGVLGGSSYRLVSYASPSYSDDIMVPLNRCSGDSRRIVDYRLKVFRDVLDGRWMLSMVIKELDM